MARNNSKKNGQRRWAVLDDALRDGVPHLSGVLNDEENFVSLLLKARDDGTCLAVLKKYSGDGTPLVCFGSAYSVSGCMVAIDATINGGNWKTDKPWQPPTK